MEGYLTFSSTDSFTLQVFDNAKHWNGTLEYSTDKKNWNTWDGTTTLNSGSNNELYLRGTGNSKITGGNGYNSDYRWKLTPSNDNKIKCIGNIETLLDYQTVLKGEHPVMGDSCYQYMFYNCTSLVQAPELPATTLADWCYYGMFNGCKSLTQAPELPAIILARNCYQCMFYDCTSLIQAPELLPATKLAEYCYANMFSDCTALVQIPKLPATELAEYCYSYMFWGCTSLVQVPKLPTTELAYRCYLDMFSGCASLKFSTTQTEECPNEYRLPTTGTGDPSINTTYYTNATVV